MLQISTFNLFIIQALFYLIYGTFHSLLLSIGVMSIPPRFLDEIRNRLTLSDIIGRRISVQRAGHEFKACCPFHKEKSPSFTINDDKQFYHCFGCGAHGDVIGFVMQHDNLAFPDAVEMLAADAGLEMPKPDPQAIQKAQQQKDLYTLMDAATAWFQGQLRAGGHQDVQDYLDKRGLGGQVQENFRIGYAPADGQALRKALKADGFSDAMMIEAGILKKSTKGGEPYAFFRDRVMFPVADKRGRVIAYGGRILPEHIRPITGDFKPPKYINSSDTPLFDKGRMLYGEQHARHAAREGHSIIVTEGYMDVIACHQAGFKGAVAPMGTALTEEQIISLWSMIPGDEKIPVLCFDGDNAGRSAASRACQRILPLLKPNQSARFAFMPEGEDPDSLLRSGGVPALKSVLQAAMPLFDFLWASHTAGRTFDTPEKRAGLEKTLQKEILQIQDTDVQRYYKELLRTRISDTFFPRYNKKDGSKKQGYAAPPKPSSLRIPKPRAAQTDVKDRVLLAAILNDPRIYEQIEESFGEFHPANTRLNDLRQNIIMAMEDDPALDAQALAHHLEMQGFKQEMDDICSESVYVHAAFCRPANRKDYDNPTKAQQWNAFWASMKNHNAAGEIRAGWKNVSNEEDEERLKSLMRIKEAEGQ